MGRLSRILPRTTLYDPPSEIRTIFLARVCSFRYHYFVECYGNSALLRGLLAVAALFRFPIVLCSC